MGSNPAPASTSPSAASKPPSSATPKPTTCTPPSNTAAAALADNPTLKPNQQGIAEALTHLDPQTLDLIASFQHAVVGNLLRQTFAAAEAYGARGIVVSGGVAANSELRRRFQSEAARRGLPVAFPSFALSTDNAAMIAAAAWPKFLTQNFAPEDLTATPQLRLG